MKLFAGVDPTPNPLSNRRRASHSRKRGRGVNAALSNRQRAVCCHKRGGGKVYLSALSIFSRLGKAISALLPSPACGNGKRVGDWTRGWGWGLTLVLLSGCVNPIPPKARAKEVAERKEPAPVPARIDGKGWHIAWRSRNLAKPGAKALPVLVADAETGEFTSDTDPPAMGLSTVRAQIFQDGAHVANIVAARIDADRDEETIYGGGGVTIHSLTNPPDTTITADAMQWDKGSSRLIATGNAKLTRPARGKQPAFSQSGNRIIYDMKQGNFDVQ